MPPRCGAAFETKRPGFRIADPFLTGLASCARPVFFAALLLSDLLDLCTNEE